MLRLLLALNLFLLNLLACNGDFESCRSKVVDSESIVNQTLQIPIQNSQRIVFSKTAPNMKIIKHDPYLSLYLVEDTKKFKYPFRINMNYAMGTLGVDNHRVVEGKILKKQVGLESFATFSEKLSTPSLLLNSCCALEGIVTERGIIEKEYIDRFLKAKIISYADFGIRVKAVGSLAVVGSINPFMENNPFMKDDIILELDGKKVKNASKLARDILFSQIGSMHNVKIKRGEKTFVVAVKSQKRVGGGFMGDSFLEYFGISFDKNLVITKIEKSAEPYGLKVGDKLIQIGTKSVKNDEDIANALEGGKKSINLLFERDHFQFFVKLN